MTGELDLRLLRHFVAVAGLPVSCSASSAPAVPPAASPQAPNNCATTSTRIVRRSSNRGGNDRYLGTGRASLRDQRGTPSLPGSVCAVQHLFAPDLRG